MRVYVEPFGTYSRAMVRVTEALKAHRTPGVYITDNQDHADLIVLHVVDDMRAAARNILSLGQRYAVIQYCLETSELPQHEDWFEVWGNSVTVWSYYDLSHHAMDEGFIFYHAPMGVDEIFRTPGTLDKPSNGRLGITTGYVHGGSGEAISEVWEAAKNCGVKMMHVGPRNVDGMRVPSQWRYTEDVPDDRLAALYRRADWVFALRHVEGFEMPAAEGLACGARAVVFDQPAMRQWYEDHAIYVQESRGQELVNQLEEIMQSNPWRVTRGERMLVADTFSWPHLCRGFWRCIERGMS